MGDLIVTIDGPAGAGKSSISRQLADRLGYRFLDTGAMYRAVAWSALQHEIDLRDARALGELVDHIRLEMQPHSVSVDGHDVTSAIRSPEVTAAVSLVADNLEVRAQLSVLQRRIGEGGRLVTEGRDQGTVIFPQAFCKIFLTASSRERAQRRLAELQQRGVDTTLDEVLQQLEERDRRDASRPIGRLARADDAVEVYTDGLTVPQVLDELESIVRQRLAALSCSPS